MLNDDRIVSDAKAEVANALSNNMLRVAYKSAKTNSQELALVAQFHLSRENKLGTP